MTIETRGYKGPLPSPDFRQMVADEVMAPFTDMISGEFTATVVRPLGIARFKGRVKNVILSVENDGVGGAMAETPRLSGEVTINKTSIFTTKPSIGHVSGENATGLQKTTFSEAADTGIIQPVINESANSFVPGDILNWTAIYGGTGSAPLSMRSPGIVVEVEPA
jgi:hypothetical protein